MKEICFLPSLTEYSVDIKYMFPDMKTLSMPRSQDHKIWHWLTHWSRVTHICVGKLSIIGSDNGLSPERRQAIIWTNAGILLTGPLGTKFSEILIEILTFSFKKMHLKVSYAKWRPFCLGLNVLYGPCMIVPHKWTKICWLATAN